MKVYTNDGMIPFKLQMIEVDELDTLQVGETAGGNDTVWNMIHYDVQLFGGVVLHQGKIAEMATGEGKTLVATLPVFLNALTGNGVHVVTVNDYLAKRDSEWMGPLYMFHGLSVDCIDKHQPNSDARRRAYLADITFGTNNEFGFDYLRDNMATNPKDLVQRAHNYAIVDEVDSVLIDDARTPLIISGPVPKGDDQLFEQYQPLVEKLVGVQRQLATQYLAEAKQMIASGDKEKVEQGFLQLYRSHKALPKNKPLIKYLSEQGIKSGMLKTEEIYMENNNKRMPEAVEPLYFVVDEKLNSVDLTDKGFAWLSKATSDPDLFVMPDITSAMSALETDSSLTDEERVMKKDQLYSDYAVKSERMHTLQQLLKAYTMFNRDDEYVIIDGEVKIVDEQTGRIMDGRRWSDGLHQAVEAKEHVKVQAATQTFATITLQNYFRMYHKLAGMTGTAVTEAGEFWDIYKLDVVEIPTNRPIARKDMNDRVYKTQREKYKAVIEEIEMLIKAGRPVLVGTTSVEIRQLCKTLDVEYHVIKTKIGEIVFEERKESSPCALCAKMRKGALNDYARQIGCNKVAYAHHMDDIIETMFLSMFYEGQFYSFAPVTHLDRSGITVIRPLMYVPEANVIGFLHKYHLPLVKNPCPADGETKREYVKQLVRQINLENPGVKKRIFHAICTGRIEGWNINGKQ